jgi:hypothetical protein
VSEGYRSGLSEDEVEELARKVMAVICREWPRSRPRLDSSVVYARLRDARRSQATRWVVHHSVSRQAER